jgi:DNA-binding transcriptional LysR family regulator
VDPRRLTMLVELSRLGSMREVAERLHTTTSTVSQQLAVLAREVGTTLLEPDGRRVRLTPAGHRLAGHAVTVLAAIDAARSDLDPTAVPRGELRVAGYASAVRRLLLPLVCDVRSTHPGVRLLINEYEPDEAFRLLGRDELDLALVYDYNLARQALGPTLVARPLDTIRWGLGVPAGALDEPGDALSVFRRFADADWIVNSRSTADEDVVRTIASLAGFAPRIRHRADSLELVADLILAGLGVGLLPCGPPARAEVRLVELTEPAVVMRCYAVTRRGRETWAPLALVLRRLTEAAGAEAR